MWLCRAAYILLLGLLLLTALGGALFWKGARLFEFVAASWGEQRYRVRIFGVAAEGEHGALLLAHLVGLAHDEARRRGFVGAVSAHIHTGGHLSSLSAG